MRCYDPSRGLPQAGPSSRYCPLLALVWSYRGLFGSDNKTIIVHISAAGGKSERILLISNKSSIFSARFGPSEPQDFRKNSAQAERILACFVEEQTNTNRKCVQDSRLHDKQGLEVRPMPAQKGRADMRRHRSRYCQSSCRSRGLTNSVCC